MMKEVTAIALAIALSLPIQTQAEELDPEITGWVDRIEVQLDKALEDSAGPVRDSSGTVTLKFNCSENGKATNVSIAKSSGNRRVDRAAMRAVEMVESYHPLPRGLSHGQPIIAVVSYDTSISRHERNRVENRKIADAGNSWYRAADYAEKTQGSGVSPR